MKSARKVNMIEGDGFPIIIQSQARNNLCKCGSGKKAKKCCGVKINANYTNPQAKMQRETYTMTRAKSLIIGRWYTLRRMKYEFGMLSFKLKKYFGISGSDN